MTVDGRTMSRFRSSFRGAVIAPSDAEYDAARHVWSALFDRRPALVVRPIDVVDVAAAIRFGREADLLITVPGGGDGITGHATCDDGLVIDLSQMRGVTVDPVARVARANGGALLAELDRGPGAWPRLSGRNGRPHRRRRPGAGGGVGRLQRRYGLTLDNLAAVSSGLPTVAS